MPPKEYCVYIASNSRRTVYYTGVTNNIERRFLEHLFKKDPHSFTARYNIDTLLYIENYSNILEAIAREKQIKRWGRDKKLALIKINNPSMEGLV